MKCVLSVTAILSGPSAQGVIGPGGVQWMTAGRGIIHSEMPKGTDGMLWGFQLWINLPAKDKMCKPRYQGAMHSMYCCPIISRMMIANIVDSHGEPAVSMFPGFQVALLHVCPLIVDSMA